MGNLGVPELIIIGLIIVVFFGARKIPEIAQGLGKGIREFRKAAREVQEASDEDSSEAPAKIAGKSTPVASTCPYCGSEVGKGARYCPSCGKSLEATRCTKCGTAVSAGTKFCPQCGEKVAP